MKGNVAVKLISGESKAGLEYAINQWLNDQPGIKRIGDLKIKTSVLKRDPPDLSGKFRACIIYNLPKKA